MEHLELQVQVDQAARVVIVVQHILDFIILMDVYTLIV